MYNEKKTIKMRIRFQLQHNDHKKDAKRSKQKFNIKITAFCVFHVFLLFWCLFFVRTNGTTTMETAVIAVGKFCACFTDGTRRQRNMRWRKLWLIPFFVSFINESDCHMASSLQCSYFHAYDITQYPHLKKRNSFATNDYGACTKLLAATRHIYWCKWAQGDGLWCDKWNDEYLEMECVWPMEIIAISAYIELFNWKY